MRQSDTDLMTSLPATAPGLTLLWTAVVDVGPRIDLGPAKGGHRYLIEILGGQFYGGPDHAALSGTVLPGGADRQFLRPDGVKELEAIYEMRTEDGTVLSIANRVTADDSRQPDRYAMSVIGVTCANGPHAWLNRRLVLGTLQSARPDRNAVVIRAWLAEN